MQRVTLSRRGETSPPALPSAAARRRLARQRTGGHRAHAHASGARAALRAARADQHGDAGAAPAGRRAARLGPAAAGAARLAADGAHRRPRGLRRRLSRRDRREMELRRAAGREDRRPGIHRCPARTAGGAWHRRSGAALRRRHLARRADDLDVALPPARALRRSGGAILRHDRGASRGLHAGAADSDPGDRRHRRQRAAL